MNPVFKLYRLQQVDSQLDQCHTRLREIEAILQDDTALVSARHQAEAAAEKLKLAQRDLRRAEQHTQAQRDKIKRTETRLYSGKVSNPKELQDLQNESAALRRYLVVLEDRQLDAMVALEEVELEHKSAQSELESIQAQTIENNASLTGERSAILAEVKRLEEEREAASSGISPDELARYDSLRSQKGGIAVARVADKTCSACGSTLSASLRQATRSPTEINRCTFCGRILYGN